MITYHHHIIIIILNIIIIIIIIIVIMYRNRSVHIVQEPGHMSLLFDLSSRLEPGVEFLSDLQH